MIRLIQTALFARLDDSTGSEQQTTAYSSAIDRLFRIIAASGKSSHHVLAPMNDFVTAFLDRAERIEMEHRREPSKGKRTGEYPQIPPTPPLRGY